jgi:hypothetical protein
MIQDWNAPSTKFHDEAPGPYPPDASSFQRFTDTFYSNLTSSQCEALDALLPSGLSSFGTSEGNDLL